MSLLEEMKKRALVAMKAKDSVATTILRLAASEVAMAETRSGKPATDDEAALIVRKLVKSNEETLAVTTDVEKRAVLARENELLLDLLPKSLSVEEIVVWLAPLHETLRGAAADGPATGMAMKHLKTQGVVAQGADVTKAVLQIRA